MTEIPRQNEFADETTLPKRKFSGPIYLQVAEMVRQSISDGDFRRGVPLPSEHDLARAFGVSVGTMRKAMSYLVEEGLIYRSRGRGTFICEQRLRRHHGELVNAKGPIEFAIRRHAIESRSADKTDAARLGVVEGARIWCVQRVQDYSGNCRSLQKATLVGTVFPFGIDAEALGQKSLIQILRLGKSAIGNIEERICAVTADSEVADILGTSPSQPLLSVHRHFFDRGGVVVAFDERIIFQQDVFYAFSGTPGTPEQNG